MLLEKYVNKSRSDFIVKRVTWAFPPLRISKASCEIILTEIKSKRCYLKS